MLNTRASSQVTHASTCVYSWLYKTMWGRKKSIRLSRKWQYANNSASALQLLKNAISLYSWLHESFVLKTKKKIFTQNSREFLYSFINVRIRFLLANVFLLGLKFWFSPSLEYFKLTQYEFEISLNSKVERISVWWTQKYDNNPLIRPLTARLVTSYRTVAASNYLWSLRLNFFCSCWPEFRITVFF